MHLTEDGSSSSQPIGGEMGGPPVMLGGASSSDQNETSGNQRSPAQNPFGGPFQQRKPPLTQATLIKNVLKLIPKFGQADKDRHQYREQIADSLIREGTNMNKDRLLELEKLIKQFEHQQQTKKFSKLSLLIRLKAID